MRCNVLLLHYEAPMVANVVCGGYFQVLPSYLTSYLCYYCSKSSTKLVKTQWHNNESTLLTSANFPLFQSFQASGGCGGTGDFTKHPTAHIGSKAASQYLKLQDN